MTNPLFYCYAFTIVALVGDIIWQFIDGNKDLIEFNYITEIFVFISLSIIAYSWFVYCVKFFPFDFCHKKITKIIAAIPTVLMSILLVLSPLLKLFFYIDENGFYQRGTLFYLQFSIVAYLLFSSIMALISIKKTVFTRQKEHYKVVAMFPLPCIILGSIQLIVPAGTMPSLQFSICLALFLVFVNEQRQKITVDGLTKLINRYEFERILNDKVKHYKPVFKKALFVFAGDIDEFKLINDNYGHNEGDRAIKAVASAIDEVATRNNGLACRRSGDEFLVVLETSNITPESFIAEINSKIDKFNNESKYKLDVSIGYACFDGNMTMPQLVDKADYNMYVIKNKKLMKKKEDNK